MKQSIWLSIGFFFSFNKSDSTRSEQSKTKQNFAVYSDEMDTNLCIDEKKNNVSTEKKKKH